MVLRFEAAKRTPTRLFAKRLRSISTSLAFSATSTPTSQASIVVECNRKCCGAQQDARGLAVANAQAFDGYLRTGDVEHRAARQGAGVDLGARLRDDQSHAASAHERRQRRGERDLRHFDRDGRLALGRRRDEQRFAQACRARDRCRWSR